jgi:hypothetical protein
VMAGASAAGCCDQAGDTSNVASKQVRGFIAGAYRRDRG